MSLTAEEIVIDFTGNTTGMDKARDRIKASLDRTASEIVKLNSVIRNSSTSTADWAKAYEKLNREVSKYGALKERLAREESKGQGGGLLERGIGNFTAMAKNHVAYQATLALEKIVTKAAEDWGGWTDAIRENNRVQYESEQIQMKRVRAIGDRGSLFEQKLGLMIDPETGRADIAGQKRALQDEIIEGENRKRQADANVRRAEKELKDYEDAKADGLAGTRSNLLGVTNSQKSNIPGVGAAEKMEIENKKKNVEETRRLSEALEAENHQRIEQQKHLNAGRTNFELTQIQVRSARANLAIQNEILGKSAEEAALYRTRVQLRKDLVEEGKNEAEIVERIAEETRELERLSVEASGRKARDAEIAADLAEKESMNARLRKIDADRLGRGFKGVEAEVLSRFRQGKTKGLSDLLNDAYEKEGDALNERYQSPFQKAADEIDNLNRLLGRKNITVETYGRAMAEVAKRSNEAAQAASRAGVAFGSAEHSARIDAYGRVMNQAAVQKDNIGRARNETANGPLAKINAEGNVILRQIAKNTAGSVNVQVANLGNE